MRKTASRKKTNHRRTTQKRETYTYPYRQTSYNKQLDYQGIGEATPSIQHVTSKSPMFMTPTELEEYNARLPNRHKHGGYPIRREEALAVMYWLLSRKLKSKKIRHNKRNKQSRYKSISRKRK